MGHYVVRRLLQAIPLMVIVSIVLFALVNLAPGGPLAGRGQSRTPRPEQVAILKRQFGLDQPLWKRYIFWLAGNDWTKVDTDGDGIKDSPGQGKGILRGDFGMSYRTRKPVIDSLRNSLKNTVYLMSVTLIVVAIIAIPVGVISAVKQYSFFDIFVTTLSFMGQAIPEFWLGLILTPGVLRLAEKSHSLVIHCCLPVGCTPWGPISQF